MIYFVGKFQLMPVRFTLVITSLILLHFQFHSTAQSGGPAAPNVDSLIRALPPDGQNDTLKIRQLITLGNTLNRLGRSEEALHYGLQARELAHRINAFDRRIQLVHHLCNIDYRNGKKYIEYEWPILFREDLVQEKDFSHWLNITLSLRSFKGAGEAFKHMLFLESIALSHSFHPNVLSDMYLVKADLYLKIGDKEKAVFNGQKVQDYAEQTGDETKIREARLWRALIHAWLDQPEDARAILPSLIRDTAVVQGEEKRNLLAQIAYLLVRIDKAAEAEDIIRRHPGIISEKSNEKILLGQIMIKQGKYAEAEKLLLDMVAGEPNESYRTSIHRELGELYFKQGRYRQAAIYLKPVAEFFNPQTIAFLNKDDLVPLELLTQALQKTGDYAGANKYLLQLMAGKDSIATRNDQNRVAQLEARELDEAQKRVIENLSGENRRRTGQIKMASGIAMIFLVLSGIVLFQFRRLRAAKRQNDTLLLNILPQAIFHRMRKGEHSIADFMPEVTVLFIDIVDFTGTSSKVEAPKLVGLLNEIFARLDALTDKYQLEKIKTIGDCYMAAAGVPNAQADHLERAVNMALEVLRTVNGAEFNGQKIYLKVGLESGPAVAGVIGRKKFIFDLWGDTVNTASRMESNGIAGSIQTTERVYQKLANRYPFMCRGEIEVKGKGTMTTYLLQPDHVN